jgi:5-methylthioadenosine/S-adenosylhomocysteine deaminase
MDERVLDDVDRHGNTIQDGSGRCSAHAFRVDAAPGEAAAGTVRGAARGLLDGAGSGSFQRRIGSLMKKLAIVVAIACAVGSPHAQTRRAVALVVRGGWVVTENPARTVLTPGAVAIDGHDIVAVDTPAAIAARFAPRDTIDVPRDVILPGLVNTHTHAPMVMYRGLADDLSLMDWLQKYIFPAEAKTVSPDMVRIGTRLAALEMIESGTTTYADMYYFEDAIARATREAGLRGVLGETIIQFPVADAKTPAEGLARAERYIAAFKDDPLITPAVAPHSTYTLDEQSLRACAALARKHGVPLLIHVAETQDEVGIIRERHHATPVGFLDAIGFWTPRTLIAHGVWVTDDDIAILKRRGVAVSHNPESNMKLASGAAPVAGYLAAGVTVGLGTDGAASNNDLDMFEAMRQAAFLAKLTTRDPTAVPARVALEMATLGGARALGLDRAIGSLEAGKRADLITVSMDSAHETPMYDPISHLVYVTRGDDVRTTIVDGKILMRDRRVTTLDAASVLDDARRLAERVRAAVGR